MTKQISTAAVLRILKSEIASIEPTAQHTCDPYDSQTTCDACELPSYKDVKGILAEKSGADRE